MVSLAPALRIWRPSKSAVFAVQCRVSPAVRSNSGRVAPNKQPNRQQQKDCSAEVGDAGGADEPAHVFDGAPSGAVIGVPAGQERSEGTESPANRVHKARRRGPRSWGNHVVKGGKDPRI